MIPHEAGPLIALLSDFGSQDAYVGIMKGVILGRCPRARIVDLGHEIPPGDVRAAAFQLRSALPYFPEGTLFVCVVDPGVGSDREIVFVQGRRQRYLAPDNGLLGPALEADGCREARFLRSAAVRRKPMSRTFHGRDIFAPAAAALAGGALPASLGPRAGRIVRMRLPKPRKRRSSVVGEVLAVDRFGNAITNLTPRDLGRRRRLRAMERGFPLRTHYAQARPGQALALVGSTGFVELSIRDGDLRALTGAGIGEAVYAD
ncbi:MAG: SAM-dependent chlorinase/fluorinase [Elusimicrobiota bacterium]